MVYIHVAECTTVCNRAQCQNNYTFMDGEGMFTRLGNNPETSECVCMKTETVSIAVIFLMQFKSCVRAWQVFIFVEWLLIQGAV
jgi:hypothetical protein